MSTGGRPWNASMLTITPLLKDTALSLACSGGKKEVADMLLKRGANKVGRGGDYGLDRLALILLIYHAFGLFRFYEGRSKPKCSWFTNFQNI